MLETGRNVPLECRGDTHGAIKKFSAHLDFIDRVIAIRSIVYIDSFVWKKIPLIQSLSDTVYIEATSRYAAAACKDSQTDKAPIEANAEGVV